MTYHSTRARREFDEQIRRSLSELLPLYKLAQSNGCSSRVLAAYYIFAYSQLEVYIKSLVEDSIAAFNIASPRFEHWPDLMLGYLLHQGEALGVEYRRYHNEQDEAAVLRKLAKTARKIAHWSGGRQSIEAARAAEFLSTKKYPSPGNMEHLFRRLGIEHLWAIVGKAGRIDGKLLLTSLNDIRTNIAHEGKIPPNFSLADFRDRMKQMSSIVAAIDRGLSSHFCSKAIKRSAWNKLMK